MRQPEQWTMQMAMMALSWLTQWTGEKIEPLPALDHANIEYDDFVKNFYEEPPALNALSFPEVGSPGRWHTCKTDTAKKQFMFQAVLHDMPEGDSWCMPAGGQHARTTGDQSLRL